MSRFLNKPLIYLYYISYFLYLLRIIIYGCTLPPRRILHHHRTPMDSTNTPSKKVLFLIQLNKKECGRPALHLPYGKIEVFWLLIVAPPPTSLWWRHARVAKTPLGTLQMQVSANILPNKRLLSLKKKKQYI